MSSSSYYETVLLGPIPDVAALMAQLTAPNTPIDRMHLHQASPVEAVDETRGVATLAYDTYPGHMHDVLYGCSHDYPEVLICTAFSGDGDFRGAMAHLGGEELYDDEMDAQRVWVKHLPVAELEQTLVSEAAALRRSVQSSFGSMSTLVLHSDVAVETLACPADVTLVQHHPRIVHMLIEATQGLDVLVGDHQAVGIAAIVAEVHGPLDAREGSVPFLEDDDLWQDFLQDRLSSYSPAECAELITALSAVLFNDTTLARAHHDTALLVAAQPTGAALVLQDLRARIEAVNPYRADDTFPAVSNPADIYSAVLAATT